MTLQFPAPNVQTLKPRPYQEEALQALNHHICTRSTNPCIQIPTGGGKSVLIAWIVQKWKLEHPPFRVCILAHRKELVRQNSDEMRGLWPGGDIGVYSAGLKSRDSESSILFASIDSIYRRGGEFAPFDVIVVDECHRIPFSGEGKYRQFIKMQKLQNPDVRVIGFTATPFRMNGPLCHPDHIMHEICYTAEIHHLIKDGYLCMLRSKCSKIQPDLTNVRKNNGGDYIVSSLAQAVDKGDVVTRAVSEAADIIRKEKRKSIIFFCVDVAHCQRVSDELRKRGIDAPAITNNTPHQLRDKVADDFKKGVLHAVCNVNIYTEGFNARQIDCIVALRPTLSRGLWFQMVGRGLRVHPDKQNCLVLDYGHCIETHGPIDGMTTGTVPMVACGDCGDTFSMLIRVCPNCGWEIPKKIIEKREQAEAERRMHEAQASERSILSNEPSEYKVDAVAVHLHKKEGKPNSLRVEYRSGLGVFREWICLDHIGMAKRKADQWWRRRFKRPAPTVQEALQDLFLASHIKNVTKRITVKQNGKYKEIIGYELDYNAINALG